MGFRRHGFIIAISYDQRMPQIRNSAWRVLPVLLLFVLYWPGLTTWFYQDDFGWLNLRHDVHSARDLAGALLAPKAHGNMRPLGENAYWLTLGASLGLSPCAFHICTFLTQCREPAAVGEHRAPPGGTRPCRALRPGSLAGQLRPGSGDGLEFDLQPGAERVLLSARILLPVAPHRDGTARVRGGALGGVRAWLRRARNQCGLPGACGVCMCCSARRAC